MKASESWLNKFEYKRKQGKAFRFMFVLKNLRWKLQGKLAFLIIEKSVCGEFLWEIRAANFPNNWHKSIRMYVNPNDGLCKAEKGMNWI